MRNELDDILRRVGAHLDAEQWRDALWLAIHLDPPTDEPAASPHEEDSSLDGSTADPADVPERTGEDAMSPPDREKRPPGLRLLVAGRGRADRRAGGAVVHPVPGGTEREPGDYARALRPLARWTAGSVDSVLDEDATVTQIVDEQIWSPVLRPTPERWFSLYLVVDRAPTMSLWDAAVRRFRFRLEGLRIFERVVELATDSAFGAEIWSPSPGRPSASGHPMRFSDDGRQVMVVVSDGAGRAWRDGSMRHTLEEFGRRLSVAVGLVLPYPLWNGLAVGVTPGRVRVQSAGQPNASWVVAPGRGAQFAKPLTTIPVLELNPRWISAWARVAGGDRRWADLPVLTGASAPDAVEVLSPVQRVERFRLNASPTAFRLACLLSGAAWLTVPVMDYVRKMVLPDSTPRHLAEVLLGGLLRVVAGEADVPAQVRYDFVDGVADHLANRGLRTELLQAATLSLSCLPDRYRAGTAAFGLIEGLDASAPYPPSVASARVLAALGRFEPRSDEPIEAPPPASAPRPAESTGEYAVSQFSSFDLDAVHALAKAVAGEDAYPKFLLAQLADIIGPGFLVARDHESRVVGFTVAAPHPQVAHRGIVLILAVDPDHGSARGRLFDVAMESLRLRGRSELWTANASAPAFTDRHDPPDLSGTALVRRFQPEDLDDVFRVELSAFGDDPYPRSFFRALEDLLGDGFLVAELGAGEDRRVVGYLLGVPDLTVADRGWVMSIAVHRDHRGRHIGQQLMEAAEAYFGELGRPEVQLTVDPDNGVAVEQFLHRGYEILAQYEDYHGLKLSRLMMRLRLPFAGDRAL